MAAVEVAARGTSRTNAAKPEAMYVRFAMSSMMEAKSKN